MNKNKRIQKIIESISRLQLEEGTNDAGLGLAKSALAKVASRWLRRDEIADQVITVKLAALGRNASSK